MAKVVTGPTRIKGVNCARPVPFSATRAEAAVGLLRALADPTRLQIVGILMESKEPLCVCDLTETFDLTQPTISHHMARLKEAGLVEDDRTGIWSLYRLRPQLEAKTRALLESLLDSPTPSRGGRRR